MSARMKEENAAHQAVVLSTFLPPLFRWMEETDSLVSGKRRFVDVILLHTQPQ